MNTIEEAKIIDQWGAFWFTRKAFRIKTQKELWIHEALSIVIKIYAIIIAFFTDLLALLIIALTYILKILTQKTLLLLYTILKAILTELAKRIGFLLTLVLTIAILYLIFSHWQQFTQTTETLWQKINQLQK